ncbi:MAG: BNR repeat-containing protein, partial [Armatimonadota bacterium]
SGRREATVTRRRKLQARTFAARWTHYAQMAECGKNAGVETPEVPLFYTPVIGITNADDGHPWSNTMTRNVSLGCLVAWMFSSVGACADRGPIKISDSLVDRRGLTIKGAFGQAINGKAFQQDAVVSHNGYQYVAYYDSERHVCVARRKLLGGTWDIIRFTDYDFTSNDAHNTISIGICPRDGTIHLAFDHHGNPLHYRVSRQLAASQSDKMLWNEELFGPVTSELEKGKSIVITYPRFWQTPDGGLQFCYRRGGSGNGDRMLVDYDPEGGGWANTRQIDSGKGDFGNSSSRCSYPNGYSYGPRERLHATWVWREGADTANHDLMYAYSEDEGRSWFNNRGEKLEGPPRVDSPGITVVKIAPEYGLMNTHGQAVDSQGRIHVVMWHCSDESLQTAGASPGQSRWGPAEARRYHHYWRDNNTVWHHRELPWVSGGRPKIFIDRKDNAYLIYDAKGSLTIAGATAASQWSDWRVLHVEDGPFVNEMLGDPYRWKDENILSIMVQEVPREAHEATALRILDFDLAE